MRTRHRRWNQLFVLATISFILQTFSDARGEIPSRVEHDRKMEGRRDKREYDQALAECRQHLDQKTLSDEERAYWRRWQLELLTLQALGSDDPFRSESWNALTQHWQSFVPSQPPNRFDIEVDLQYWLGRQSWCELLGDWADLSAESDDFRTRAIDGLREVDRELTKLADRVEKIDDDRSKPARGQLTPHRALKYRIAYQRGVTNETRATLYPEASPDRVLLLTEALKVFSPLARLTNDSPLVVASQLREIACQRLLGNDTKAAQLLNAFAKKHPVDKPGVLRLQWLIERAELETAISAGATQLAALTKAASDRGATGVSSDLRAEAHWTVLSGAVRRWQAAKQAGDAAGAEQWQIQALTSQRALEADHSRLWIRRGEALLARTFEPQLPRQPEPNRGTRTTPNSPSTKPSPSPSSTSSSTASPSTSRSQKATTQDLEIKIRTANDAFTRGEKDRALAAYDEAAHAAQDLADLDLAFRLRFQAAAIVHEQQKHEAAIERFQQLSLDQKAQKRAAEAHWIAVLHAAAIASKSQATSELYEALLREHLEHWNSDPTSNDARFWLGKLLNQRGQTEEAQTLWEAIEGDFKNWLELWPQLRAHYLAQWKQKKQAGDDPAMLIEHVKSYWQRWEMPTDRQQDLTMLECMAFWYGAEWRILYALESSDDLRQMLDRVVTAAACPAEIRMRANALAGLLAALADDASAASEHWKSVDWKSLEVTERVLQELDRVATERKADDTKSLSRLLLEITAQVQDVPSWSDNPDLWQFASRAHLRLEQRDDAMRIYQRQAKRHPKQAIWFAELAKLEEQITTRENAELALDHWRVVVRFSTEDSDLWFDGKLGIVRMLLRLQQPDRASEVIRVLETLHPELGGEERAAQFRALAKQASSRGKSAGTSNP